MVVSTRDPPRKGKDNLGVPNAKPFDQLSADSAGRNALRVEGMKEMISIIEKKTALRVRPRLASRTEGQVLSGT